MRKCEKKKGDREMKERGKNKEGKLRNQKNCWSFEYTKAFDNYVEIRPCNMTYSVEDKVIHTFFKLFLSLI